jgi:hypothetical protein
MTHRLAAAAALAVAAVVPLHAQAASGSLDSFSASATEVVAGSWVDFSVGYSVQAGQWSYGGSNPTEPEPQEGYQEWNVNWYYVESETVNSVSLQIGSESTTDFPAAPAGSSYAGSWTVSIYFDTPGQYSVSAGGSWAADVSNYYSNESAYRNCYYTDPDYSGPLQCDAWTWTYSDGGDWYSTGDGFAPLSLNINVSAVPEPGALALWLAGAALLAARARQRRRWVTSAARGGAAG